VLTSTINVDPPFVVVTLTLDNGDQFFAIRCDGVASIILPGFNAEAIEQARTLARALDVAAIALGESLAPAGAVS
jgi:hypothetical protein